MIEEFIEKQRLIEDQKKKQMTPEKIRQIEAVYRNHEVVHYCTSWIHQLFVESGLHLCLLHKPDKYAFHFYHCHGWFELVYAYRGNCYNHFLDTNETLILKEKEVLILHHKTPHCTCGTTENDLIFSFVINLDLIKNVLLSQCYDDNFFFLELYGFLFGKETKQSYLYFPSHPKYRLEPILEIMANEMERNQSGQRSNIVADDSISQAIILLMLSLLSQRRNRNSDFSNQYFFERKTLWQMYHYIQNHLSKVTLSDLAKQFGYTPTYLSHLFREKIGDSYTSVVHHLRMERAKVLLKDKDISISQIASEIGMNYDTFHKLFKKTTNMTPTQFRNLYHRENYFLR